MSIDLDALERLAADATPGPWSVSHLGHAPLTFHDERDVRFILDACDPATVAALTRAVRAALKDCDGPPHCQECVAALEPFRTSA